MKWNLQISDKFWGRFWKIIAICNPVKAIYRVTLNAQPKGENSKTAQIKWAIRDFQAELARLQKEENLLRFQPCRGDVGLRHKEETLEVLKKRIRSLDEKIWELGKKLRDIMSEAILNPN